MNRDMPRGVRVIIFFVVWWLLMTALVFVLGVIGGLLGGVAFGVGVYELLIFGTLTGLAAYFITRDKREGNVK